jgi:hypothetical protein
MRTPRSIVILSGLAVAGSALLVPGAAAEPSEPEGSAAGSGATEGRGPATALTARVDNARVESSAAAAPPNADPIVMPTSYPSQPQLRFYRDNPDDASYTADLLGHPDLAPQLTEWMDQSNRISTQVIGQSVGGRDLYLVTVTAPETEEFTAQQTAWREQIKNDPEAAAVDSELLAQYKTPVWVSANIHGNEWEGTDSVMQYIDWLVSAPSSEVSSVLRNNRLYFSLSLNPDGRTLAARATSLGLDANRDMVTNRTPEATSFVRTAQAVQPIYSADLHGYTRVLQVEPTGPPHGSNYEYDQYLPHNYALALQVERDVVDADIPGNTYYNIETGQVVPVNTGPETAHIKIPYRDTPSGWDDFPPIFTAQYAAFFGAATSTVELPLQRGANNGTRQTPERARVNTAVGLQTVKSTVDYMNDTANAREMLESQIEVFRRGVAGEPKTSLTTENIADVPGPDQWKPLWDVADDQEPVDLPRAYVIPVGDDQRSASDAADLVRALLFHDIEVGRLEAPASVGGTTYPAGSYVVDMHQPLRGLANSLLDLGDDISDKVPDMYDISAWSWSYLWGATVDKVGDTVDGPIGTTSPVTTPAPVTDAAEGDYRTLDLAGIGDVEAVNELLDGGVPSSLLESGAVVVEADDAALLDRVAEDYDVGFDEATPEELDALSDAGTRDLDDLDVAYSGTQDDRLSLGDLGFGDLTLVSTSTLNGDPGLLAGAEVLWVGSSLTLTPGTGAHTAVQELVDRGGAVVGRGAAAFEAARTMGLVSGDAVTGNRAGNGIVDVETTEASFLAPYAQESSFIYPATWFTGLGEGTEVVQRYGMNPLLAGHWVRGTDGDTPVLNGPDDAADRPAVVTGEGPSGSRAVAFGTAVFFRTHPHGGMSQAGRSILWAGPEGEGVQVPVRKASSSTRLRLDKQGGRRVAATVTVRADDLTPRGQVVLREGRQAVRVFRLRPDDDGRRTVTVRLDRGLHKLRAVYAGTSKIRQSRSAVKAVRIG